MSMGDTCRKSVDADEILGRMKDMLDNCASLNTRLLRLRAGLYGAVPPEPACEKAAEASTFVEKAKQLLNDTSRVLQDSSENLAAIECFI